VEFPEINRKTTSLEYMKVVKRVREMNFAFGFIQDKTSARQEYVPKFDYK
jgi:putative pyruvate formate lyase activating enzyme